MAFTHGKRSYELQKGSDVDRDVAYLELYDVSDGPARLVLYGEKDDSGVTHLLSLCNRSSIPQEPILLPTDLVGQFIQWLQDKL